MPKFTIEAHEERMRQLLNQKAQVGQRPNVLQRLLDKTKQGTKLPSRRGGVD